ncbi:MAG: MBL fold metallo-hydrolase [Anaerolineaceae bacterium]|nr:MBL fold metallo-hydrolase [Anaerolineaceae bacterium]
MIMTQTRPVIQRFESSTGARIYRIPMDVFPGFIGYAYLLLGAGVPTLVDTGSGYQTSTDDLLSGLSSLADEYGEAFQPSDIERVIITHGHVDHFGGLGYIMDAIGSAQIGIHPLDRRILTNYDERVLIATKNLTIYLQEAGVPQDALPELLQMYSFSKMHVRSMPVDFTLEEGDEVDGMQIYHVPGHCSGQIAIRLGDVLLSADHILSRTAPHLAAESITHYTGVGHYLEALDKMRRVEGIRLVLGGHEDPVTDMHKRIDELETRIHQKKQRVIDILAKSSDPMTIFQITQVMYPEKHGFNHLLALQQAGAYVEYLYDRGYLCIANLDDVRLSDNPPLYYGLI